MNIINNIESVDMMDSVHLDKKLTDRHLASKIRDLAEAKQILRKMAANNRIRASRSSAVRRLANSAELVRDDICDTSDNSATTSSDKRKLVEDLSRELSEPLSLSDVDNVDNVNSLTIKNIDCDNNQQTDSSEWLNITDTTYVNDINDTTKTNSINDNTNTSGINDINDHQAQCAESQEMDHVYLRRLSDSDLNALSEELPDIIKPSDYKILQILRSYRKSKRIKEQQTMQNITRDSNRRISEVLLKNVQRAVDDGGVDVYAYFNYHNRIKHTESSSDGINITDIATTRYKCKKFCFRLPNQLYKYGVAVIVILIQICVPVILLVTQMLIFDNFTPSAHNVWFRIVGFLTMSHSTAVLRKQIINQVSWQIIDNNKVLARIDPETPRPRTKCLFIGLYVNMLMSLVVITNIYILYCQTEEIINLILNMVALNFLLDIDNDAFKMMVGNDKVEEIILQDAENQIKTLIERANYHEIRIVRKMKITLEYVLFYLIVAYSMCLPFLFMFHDVNNLINGIPCLGVGEQNMTAC
jgi:hypothetical protein